MESTIPSNVPTTVIPQNSPSKNRARVNDASRGFFYYFSFLTVLASLLLIIVAITKDELTKVTFHTTDGYWISEYCGWHNVHFDTSQTSNPENIVQTSYSQQCSNGNHACKLTKAGRGWYGLIIISIVFEGLALMAFIFDFMHPLAYTTILIFDMLSFLCTLAAVLTWGIRDYCQDGCNSLNFPYGLPANASSCHPKFAVSWTLSVISGGFALLAFISLIISRMLANKRY
jgi:hypothetical protein